MPSMFMRLRVADYEKWKQVFDEREDLRRQAGATAHSVHRDPDDPNVVTVALRVKDISRAREYAGSAELRSAMERAGLQGAPEIWFGEDIEDKHY